MERGIIRNKQYATQIRDFSGLKFGNITPTDVDAFIDFHNRLFVFIEGKHGDAKPPFGQRLALERLTDKLHNPPETYAVCILASHKTEGDIIYHALPVTEYRWEGKWEKPSSPITVKEAIERLIKITKQ
jgi:hypothetical protein